MKLLLTAVAGFFFLAPVAFPEEQEKRPRKTMAETEVGDEESGAGAQEQEQKQDGDESNLTPKYLLDQFAADADAAWKKYKGRKLSVSGYIRELGADKAGKFVIVGTYRHHNSNPRNTIRCVLEDAQGEGQSEFQPGEFVRVEGSLAKGQDVPYLAGAKIFSASEPNTFNREFVQPKFKECEKCNGSGFVRVEKENFDSKKMLSNTKKIKCPACSGKGKIKISNGYYRKIGEAEDASGGGK